MAQEQEGIPRGTETAFRLSGELLGPNPGEDRREVQDRGGRNMSWLRSLQASEIKKIGFKGLKINAPGQVWG